MATKKSPSTHRNKQATRIDAFPSAVAAIAPLIADIQRFSLDNGPGIRSTVFFKGCGLRCAWCHNPQLQDRRPQIVFFADRCIDCRLCVNACRDGVENAASIDTCDHCGRCADACPTGALRIIGTPMSPEQLASRLLDDLPFYAASGGGVTFSGGEPALFSAFCAQTARILKSHSVHLAMQTAGMFPWDEFSTTILPLLDHIYFDLKTITDADHTGLSDKEHRQIMNNFRRLARGPIPITATMVLVPNFNDDPETISAMRDFFCQGSVTRFETKPFNSGSMSRHWADLKAPLRRDPTKNALQQQRTTIA